MMAAKESKANLRSSLIEGSEEAFALSCDPCSIGKLHLHVEAKGYCLTCSDFLCQVCYEYHCKLAATRHHKLLDKSSMPRTKVKGKESLTELCTKHPDKTLEYVCNVHDILGCVACMTVNHATCKDKSYIPDVSDSFTKNLEWKRLYDDLGHLVSLATGHTLAVNAAEKENEGMQSKCLAKIDSWRNDIDKMLDMLQLKARQRVVKLYQYNKDTITKTLTVCQTTISELQNMISNLKTKEKDGKKNPLYVDIKLSSKRASLIEGHIKDMKSLDIKRYEIVENEKLHELESTLSDLLALSVYQDGPVTKAQYQKGINVKSDDDKNNCYITGLTVLEKGRIVVTDGGNNNVKLIDVKKNKVVSRVPVTAEPRDVAQIKHDKVAVILGNRTILLVNVTSVLSTIKVIQVSDTDMYGICSYHDKVLVACRKPACLKLIDMSGEVVQTLDKNTDGEVLVISPSRLEMNSDKTLIFVTEYLSDTVTTMTMDGKIENVYKNGDLMCPVGVTVGRYGEVFVCSHDTHTLHQLSSFGQFTRVLLGKDQNLPFWPQAICHSYDENALYISSSSLAHEEADYIRMFKLQ